MSAHTPIPWEAKVNGYDVWFVYGGPELESRGTKYRALVAGGNSHDTLSQANAELIVRAVNSHEVTLAALDHYADQLCEGWCEQSPDCANFDDCGGCLARRTAWKARGESL